MLSEYATSWKSRLRQEPGLPVERVERRASHGSIAWSHLSEDDLRQPQDGAAAEVSEARSRVAEIPSRLQRPQLLEPEDAWLTGGTRSLMRRLTGLNIGRKIVPELGRKMAPGKLMQPTAKEPQVA